jgi:hypothetical protein
MKPLYTQKEFELTKADDLLPCQCYYCDSTFYKIKKEITHNLKYKLDRIKFCSQQCNQKNNSKQKKTNCKNCNIEFLKKQREIDKTKNNFCCKSCAATYNNKNKIHGVRRSKLESWIEKQLTQLYPSLRIDFNQKTAINSELDIYIPSLNVAFELNGIFHYEPIYGVDKLQQIQENDVSKSKACHEAKIDLCTIDTSGQKYFKESTSQKYLDIINNIIKERLLTS